MSTTMRSVRTGLAVSMLGALAFAPSSPSAATIERHLDPVMGCAVRVSGQIVEGDGERLRRILETLPSLRNRTHSGPLSTGRGFRVCFDSPGGSFPEAIRIARLLHELVVGTAIEERARCESACALAFMGGTSDLGEDSGRIPERVLHPRGVLGFHAPDLIIGRGQYTETEVGRAYALALQSVSAILDLSEDTEIVFSQSLLREMLATPPDAMLRLERVEQALDWSVSVGPTRLSGLPMRFALESVCGAWLWGDEAMVRTTVDDFRSDPSNPGFAVFLEVDQGFGAEASEPCAAILLLHTMAASQAANQERYFRTYPRSTRISDLPQPDPRSDLAIMERFLRPTTSSDTHMSCWLTSPTARIINVSTYVNLRRRPEFSATVIREVPLGEQVRVLTPNSNTAVGDRNNACRNACQAYGRNPNDRQARDRVQQCINDNILWYEITDARGNRGWVSRRFLEEAPR